MNSLLNFAYVRILSGCYVTSICIYTLLLGSVWLHVMNIRNLLNSQVPHNGECSFMCAVCKKSFKQANALMMHLQSHTGGRPFNFVFLGNLSSSWYDQIFLLHVKCVLFAS